jgi:hypothetical protein
VESGQPPKLSHVDDPAKPPRSPNFKGGPGRRDYCAGSSSSGKAQESPPTVETREEAECRSGWLGEVCGQGRTARAQSCSCRQGRSARAHLHLLRSSPAPALWRNEIWGTHVESESIPLLPAGKPQRRPAGQMRGRGASGRMVRRHGLWVLAISQWINGEASRVRPETEQ